MAATFVVEDGTGLADANAYTSVAFADQYHANHGNPAIWADTAATATLVLSVNPSDDDTFTVDSTNDGEVIVRFKSTLAAANDVLIGADVEETQRNLVAAINRTGNDGVWYHTDFPVLEDWTIGAFASNQASLVSLIAGEAGNETTTSETFTSYENTLASFAGGVNLREEAIRIATQYLDVKYGNRWVERKTHDEQALEWPRAWVKDRNGFAVRSDTVPVRVQEAVCSLAKRHLEGTALLPDQAAADRGVVSTSVRAGPVSKSTTYRSGGKNAAPKFPEIDLMLTEFLTEDGRVWRA